MRREVVERRHWLEETAFFDYFAACQLIPGPTSTELAILLGYKRAGIPGLLVAGGLFILPAALIMLGLAWAYARFASSPIVAGALHGIRPVVVGIIAWALIDLGRRILRGPWPVVTGLGVMIAALIGWNGAPGDWRGSPHAARISRVNPRRTRCDRVAGGIDRPRQHDAGGDLRGFPQVRCRQLR